MELRSVHRVGFGLRHRICLGLRYMVGFGLGHRVVFGLVHRSLYRLVPPFITTFHIFSVGVLKGY